MKQVKLITPQANEIAHAAVFSKNVDSKWFLKSALDYTPPQQGITVTEMRNRLRIIEIIEKAKDTLLLEDADYTVLCDLFAMVPWGVNERFIIRVQDELVAAKTVEPKV